VLFVAFGHLGILFLYFINFSDVDKCDVFLPVNFFQLQTPINGSIADHIYFFLDKWKLDCKFLGACLLHY
jgi:hypothetical protein